jgi:hypothetical protein
MAVTHGWDNPEKTIYRVNLDNRWTWKEFSVGTTLAYQVISSAHPRLGAQVDLIICVNSRLPFGDPQVYLRRALDIRPLNLHRMLIVNDSGLFLELMIHNLVKAERDEAILVVNTLDQARTILGISPSPASV